MSRRSDRVAEAIRREAGLLVNDQVRDPRIGFVTITKVTVTADLRNAFIYYTAFGNEKAKKKADIGLKSALPFIRGEIGNRLKLRYTPEVHFRVDKSMDEIQKIESALKKVSNERKNEGINNEEE